MEISDVKFSVLMSVYKNDNAFFFKKAVESIYDEQILKPTEIVLVEDGELTDDLYTEISLLKNKLGSILKVVKLEQNMGLGKALNKGLIECSHELVARMDSDDISVPERFRDQINMFVQDPNISILGGNISEFIEEETNVVGTRIVYENELDIKKDMKRRCALNHVTIMFKKSDILKIGNYLDWFCNEDYYLWIRAMKQDLTLKNLNKTLVYVRVGLEMYGRRGGMKYFLSEAKLQKYMFDSKLITMPEYIRNVLIRCVVQLLLPNKLRKFIYLKFLRKKS